MVGHQIYREGLQPYTYNSATNFGTAHFYNDTRIPPRIKDGGRIYVDVVKIDATNQTQFFQRSVAQTLDHKNILPCLWHDYFDDGSSILVYRRYATTFSNHMINNPTIVGQYTIPTIVPPPVPWTYDYLSNDYRLFFKGLLEAVVYIHDQGYSLFTLNVNDNLAIYQGRLVLHSFTAIDDISDAAKGRDFELVAGIFRTILLGQAQCTDIQHLIYLLENYNPGYENLLANHMALLTRDKRICAINNFYMNRKYVPTAAYNIIINTMATPQYWPQWFSDPTFSPGLGVALECFSHKNRHNQPSYDLTTLFNTRGALIDRNLKYMAIKFCRDMTAHIDDHIHKYKQTAIYTQEDKEFIVMRIFGDIMCEFQRAAYAKGLLDQFMLFD